MTGERLKVVLLGASGTMGRATAAALTASGHEARCVLRPGSRAQLPESAEVRRMEITDRAALREVMEGADAVISCMASRTGAPEEAWAIDHGATVAAFEAGREAGVGHFVLLSAICVQKPRLAFQEAKLAAEDALVRSGLRYSIVRPTAFFKSLSGQVERVRAGRPYLIFGDGEATACKPISDNDLARFLVDCLTDPAKRDAILPVGGPGPALTPRAQGEMLFELTGEPPRFRRVPHRLLDGIVLGLDVGGRLSSNLKAKAELARIGRYYATESMLLLDPATGRYDADATPEYGTETLRDHYARMLSGEVADDRGDHAVF
ncbi:NAD(P)H-binding protein [Histidinibacterium aquaticum]|uniref:Divinyl chlorophyllide a 8-vinyl-reductase, chloroplastic n=1 Tax=Histidinibacterium aquaticum TaxID=2613962 RepID=A0A5J5GEX1_9RHOB|nr:NAD(P)H-binding protein [Histidinibacterium aquaticum]KAA9006024.1 NAD(P)H-binding protein [Histidinibacterium aquaticum]